MNGPTNPRVLELLLVEDNPGDVDLTKVALKKCMIANHVAVARDGEEAMAILHRQGEHVGAARPDLVFLDLNMPKKNGMEVLQEIKQDPSLRRIPVVVMTSSKAEEDILRSYDLHANCFVTKPVDLDQFRTVVKSIEDFWFSLVRLPTKVNCSA